MRDPELIKAIDKIFSLDSNLDDITLGLDIKNTFCPRKIYKFRTLSEYSINNVINNDIWFNNPINMNDPYDCKFMWDNFADRNLITSKQYLLMYANAPEEFDPELFEYISNNKVSFNEYLQKIKIQGLPATPMIDVLRDLHEDLIGKLMNAYLKSIYFCSFSENFSSILMWAHYSNNHYGFCIEYDSTNVQGYNPYIHHLYPILYTDKLFNVSDLFYDKRDRVKSKNFNNLYLNYPLIYKSYEWDYEKEWRVIHAHGIYNKAQNFPTPPISSILLGSNFFKPFDVEEENKTFDYYANRSLAVQLISHCMKKNIELKIMKHSLSTYSMMAITIPYDKCFKLLCIDK